MATPMKLIVQIPCYNEEHTLPQTVADIPREIPGIDQVEVLIIDDGSADRTTEVAREVGVDHIVVNRRNRGLARTFRRGLEECLKRGADIIVNTDGDNQYFGADIPKLVQPILEGRADLVVGDRETDKITHFSPLKKFLQWLGSGIVRKLAGVWVPDTVSGFRAFSRDTAIMLNIVSPFSYTIETVIQAGKRGIAVTSVPVRTNPKTRESRLFKGMTSFITRQVTTIVRMYAMYQPLKVFFIIGTALTVVGALPILRFVYFYLIGQGDGHIQSLVLGGVLVLMGFIAYLAGLVADLISFNRQLLEMTLERVRRLELQGAEAGEADAAGTARPERPATGPVTADADAGP
jgi:glycosyltransferase involved in cell wall biosynthesis